MHLSSDSSRVETEEQSVDGPIGRLIDGCRHLMRRDLDPTTVSILFGVAVVFGISLKLAFGSFVTIGYEDYRLALDRPNMSLNELQAHLIRQGGSLAYKPTQTAGPACPDTNH